MIHIQLDNLLVTLKISSEKNISFRVFDDLYSGFLDDTVTDNTTDNKISEQANNNDKQFDQKSDVELDFDSEALELLKKGMKLNAVKRCSDVYGINLAEAMKKVDEFVNNHSELLN